MKGRAIELAVPPCLDALCAPLFRPVTGAPGSVLPARRPFQLRLRSLLRPCAPAGKAFQPSNFPLCRQVTDKSTLHHRLYVFSVSHIISSEGKNVNILGKVLSGRFSPPRDDLIPVPLWDDFIAVRPQIFDHPLDNIRNGLYDCPQLRRASMEQGVRRRITSQRVSKDDIEAKEEPPVNTLSAKTRSASTIAIAIIIIIRCGISPGALLVV